MKNLKNNASLIVLFLPLILWSCDSNVQEDDIDWSYGNSISMVDRTNNQIIRQGQRSQAFEVIVFTREGMKANEAVVNWTSSYPNFGVFQTRTIVTGESGVILDVETSIIGSYWIRAEVESGDYVTFNYQVVQ